MRHTSWRAGAIFAALALSSSTAGAGVVVTVSNPNFTPMCHAPDTEGPPMANSCGSCAAKVCSIDSYCCEVTWDSVCVSEAASLGPLGGC